MEPPDPSFADDFNVPQEDDVLVFEVRRAAVLHPFQVHRLKVLVEAGLVAFSSACFEFADGVPNSISPRQPCAPSEGFFQPFSRPFEGCCCGVLRVGASSPPLSVAMLRSSQLPHRAARINPVLCVGAQYPPMKHGTGDTLIFLQTLSKSPAAYVPISAS